MKKHIPNLITCGNLFSGCLAIVSAMQGKLEIAALLIFTAGLFDLLDGLAARLLHVSSPMGKELDSLADVVSFGVAPAIILFCITPACSDQLFFSLLPYSAFLITIFSAIRLAKFNIDQRQTTSFIGLPTPAMAFFVASLPFISAATGCILQYPIVTPLISIVLASLMVAELPLFSLKFSGMGWKGNKTRYVFIVLALICAILFFISSIPLVIALYILLSLASDRFNYFKN